MPPSDMPAQEGWEHSAAEDVAERPRSRCRRQWLSLRIAKRSLANTSPTCRTFEIGVPALLAARQSGLGWTDAAVDTYLDLLESQRRHHIARKLGVEAAEAVSAEGPRGPPAGGTRSLQAGEAAGGARCRAARPREPAEPRTTADLTCAAIFVVILEGGWDR